MQVALFAGFLAEKRTQFYMFNLYVLRRKFSHTMLFIELNDFYYFFFWMKEKNV